ncbi:MAG: hypothetical protein EXR75_14940 [Myxococcales bacterium]|nr:hypothetical protein [Myxococcales bacterium]
MGSAMSGGARELGKVVCRAYDDAMRAIKAREVLASASTRVKTALRLSLHLVVGVLIGLSVTACCEAPERAGTIASATLAPDSICERDTRAVDAALLAYLSKARSVHLEADLAEADGGNELAIRVLAQFVAGPALGAEQPVPEVREVLADTLARLADLRAARGEFDAAEAELRRGLELAVERTHFRGRLMEVRGALEKRRFEALRSSKDERGAQLAKERSLAALREAVAIQEDVIAGAVGSDTGGRGP